VNFGNPIKVNETLVLYKDGLVQTSNLRHRLDGNDYVEVGPINKWHFLLDGNESLGKVKTPKFIPNDRKYDGLWMWNSE
jgi:hypothetical protein